MAGWGVPDWFEDLPQDAADYVRDVPLADYTTIKVGGSAEVFADVKGWDGLAELVRWCFGNKVPLTLIGKGSNMVIADGGVAGVVAHLGKGFDAVRVEGDTVYAEAGAACGTAARAAREAELEGLAFFGGIPGSVGGALKMNAGAYKGETFADLKRLWIIDCMGETKELAPEEVQPRYRGTTLPEGAVYKAGLWRLRRGDKEAIRGQMQAINRARSSTQPLHLPSSGSWFKNVIVDAGNVEALRAAGLEAEVGGVVNAWRVVDAAGCRGWRENGAQVSEQHCNFFVNIGLKEGQPATCADLDALSLRVEAAVREKLGIGMVREVRFIGTRNQGPGTR